MRDIGEEFECGVVGVEVVCCVASVRAAARAAGWRIRR